MSRISKGIRRAGQIRNMREALEITERAKADLSSIEEAAREMAEDLAAGGKMNCSRNLKRRAEHV